MIEAKPQGYQKFRQITENCVETSNFKIEESALLEIFGLEVWPAGSFEDQVFRDEANIGVF